MSIIIHFYYVSFIWLRNETAIWKKKKKTEKEKEKQRKAQSMFVKNKYKWNESRTCLAFNASQIKKRQSDTKRVTMRCHNTENESCNAITSADKIFRLSANLSFPRSFLLCTSIFIVREMSLQFKWTLLLFRF